MYERCVLILRGSYSTWKVDVHCGHPQDRWDGWNSLSDARKSKYSQQPPTKLCLLSIEIMLFCVWVYWFVHTSFCQGNQLLLFAFIINITVLLLLFLFLCFSCRPSKRFWPCTLWNSLSSRYSTQRSILRTRSRWTTKVHRSHHASFQAIPTW